MYIQLLQCQVPPARLVVDVCKTAQRNLDHRYLAPNHAPVPMPIKIGVAASPSPVMMPCSKKPILACCKGCPVGFNGLVARLASCTVLKASFDSGVSLAAKSAWPSCLLTVVSLAACGRQAENISGIYRRLMSSDCCGNVGAAGPIRRAEGIVLMNEASALMY